MTRKGNYRYGPLLTGQRFGGWLILDDDRGPRVLARCVCGTERQVCRAHLHTGASQSCGCGRRASGAGSRGRDGTPEYAAWKHMLDRCLNPKSQGWDNYGARGIRVCDRWRESYDAFLADMGERPSSLHSLERIDNESGYCPENCTWATRRQQTSNTRRTRRVTAGGETLTLSEWSERLGVNPATINHRLRAGWDPQVAVTTPSRYPDRRSAYWK